MVTLIYFGELLNSIVHVITRNTQNLQKTLEFLAGLDKWQGTTPISIIMTAYLSAALGLLLEHSTRAIYLELWHTRQLRFHPLFKPRSSG